MRSILNSKALKLARVVLSFGLAALALWAVYGKKGELSSATHYLDHVDWGWLLLAFVVEILSVAGFSEMVRTLIRSGGTKMGFKPVFWITMAGNSITNSLPAGPAWASAFAFQQFKKKGADSTLAGWVLVAMVLFSSISLALLSGLGLLISELVGAGTFGTGTTVLVVVLLSPLAWLAVAFGLHRRARLQRGVEQLLAKVLWPIKRDKQAARTQAQGISRRLTSVIPAKWDAVAALTWSLSNWLLDFSCLCLSFLAVGVRIPWSGLLLAYGAGQLAANLPITPGGLGVVEGSLEIAIIAFGGGTASSVAAILIYRIMSFWILLPLGWGSWAGIVLSDRRQSRSPDGLESGSAISEDFTATAQRLALKERGHGA